MSRFDPDWYPFDPQASGYGRPPHPRADFPEWAVTCWSGGAYCDRGLTREAAEELAARMDYAAPNARPYRVVHDPPDPQLCTSLCRAASRHPGR